ncbi:hypothetical protein VP01_534g3 [Puccinia sorghi]|uniref:Uncharacterized protein n=1 Tax=Puccinia sorghi TaxID=27349 RepID=A0A0L6UK46_9BASI|nr:hypothetical protein VP01_534g3 [Puccinia sorghi]
MFGSKSDQHGSFWTWPAPWIVVMVLMNVSFLLTGLVPKMYRTGTRGKEVSRGRCGRESGSGTRGSEVTGLEAGLPGFSSIRVVSLASRTDRRAHMQRLAAFLRLPNLLFSDAVLYSDPRVLDTVQRVGNHTKADKRIAELGHVACRLSHHRAILAADNADDQVTLILEA